MSIFESTTPSTPDTGASEGSVSGPGVAAPDTGTADLGSATVPVVEGGASAPSYLDVEQYGTHLVKLKVDGADVERPLSDVIKSDMLQQDYTRKTQALAEDRRRLQQADALVAALESDPAGTLRQLSDVYDLDPDAGLSPIERAPEEQQLRQMQSQLAQQQQLFQRQRIETEIASLTQQYGNIDLPATARFAQENGTTLTLAAELMQAREGQRQQQESAVAEQRRQAALAAQTVHDGTVTARGAVGASSKPIGSLRDAWMAAKAPKT